MGDRMSERVASRKEMPQYNLTANAENLARGPDRYPASFPEAPLCERVGPRIAERTISALLAQNQAGRAWITENPMLAAQAAFTPPLLALPDVQLGTTVTPPAYAFAATAAGQQPAKGCCPCPPCQLL